MGDVTNMSTRAILLMPVSFPYTFAYSAMLKLTKFFSARLLIFPCFVLASPRHTLLNSNIVAGSALFTLIVYVGVLITAWVS